MGKGHHMIWHGARRGAIWAVFAIGALALAACSGASSSNVQPTSNAIVQSTNTSTSSQPAATAAAPTLAPTLSAVAQPTAAQATSTQASAAAPSCSSPAALTPAVTEGPYFKAGSPERASLLTSGMAGTQLVVTGYVLTADCKPVAHALLDFWQADSKGNYDNSGYTLRGHQFTDANGRYQLTTVVPGLYPGRTEHIHVKVQAPNGQVLTTQLFFPGVANNASDGIFDPKLLLKVQDTGSGLNATFDFVVKA